MNETKISSISISFCIIAGLFLEGALVLFFGDILNTLLFQAHQNLDRIFQLFIVFATSSLIGFIFLLKVLPRISKLPDSKASIKIGIVTGSLLMIIITFAITPKLLFSSFNFNLEEDYLLILRNLSIGILAIWSVKKIENLCID